MEATNENIDDLIEKLNNDQSITESLYEFLGLTLEEYYSWVVTGKLPVK